jgi:hypothetical protein
MAPYRLGLDRSLAMMSPEDVVARFVGRCQGEQAEDRGIESHEVSVYNT